MAVLITQNLNLEKPDYNEPADIQMINANMDKIDAFVGDVALRLSAVESVADDALATANQALSLAQQNKDAIIALNATVTDNSSKIQVLWDAIFGDITTNPFEITFQDLSGITLESGVWNESLQRLEC